MITQHAGTPPSSEGPEAQRIAMLRAAILAGAAGPRNFHALGVALRDAGQPEQAAVALRRAFRAHPHATGAITAYASVLRLLGRTRLARAALETGALANPASLRIAFALARLQLRAAGTAQSARTLSRAVLRAAVGGGRGRAPADSPGEAARHAVKTYVRGMADEAYAAAERVLKDFPDQPDALVLTANILADRADAYESRRRAKSAVDLEPFAPEFLLTLATCERLCDRPAEAIAAVDRAIALDPDLQKGYVARAALMLERERFDAAEQAARRALELKPGDAGAMSKLIRALIGQDRNAEAEQEARAAIARHGESADLLTALGQSLRAQGRTAETREVLLRALQLGPESASTHLTYGLFLFTDLADIEGARPHYEASMRLEPRDPVGRLNLAILQMAQGDYSSRSWELYEHRRRQPTRMEFYRRIPLPEWDGRELPDGGLLVYGEQGIGDEIMFSSMVPEAAARVARCGLACDPRLTALLQRSFPGVRCVAWDREGLASGDARLQGFTHCIPAGTLGTHFRSGGRPFARSAPFLAADPERTRLWRRRLEAIGPGPFIGIGWRGGVHATGRSRRSLPPDAVATALSGVKANWISLQHDAKAGEIDMAGFSGRTRLAHLPEVLADIDETAALVAALDAVVTVCSWLVHVCGGLGRPAFVLAPLMPDFRYGISGTSMPWYRSVRMYRQDSNGDWRAPLAALSAELPAVLAPGTVPL